MRSFFQPSDGPTWLGQVLTSIRGALSDIWPGPLRLKDYATVDLPAAADFKQGIAWNATVSRVTYSDGSAWIQVMPYTAGAALTKVNDTNVTLTLGGTPATALLAATSLTLGWTGTLAAARGGTGVGTLGDITRTNDTNVTLTLGGAPVGALITSTSFTLGWTGTLAALRGGTGVSSLGDLTKVDDTNVTLTLGGTPTGSLIKSASITVGWTGQLSVARGGTSFGSYTIGDLIQASASGTLAKLAAVATGNVLISGGVGVVSSWGKVGLTTHVSGTLGVGNGGTGITAFGTGVATALGINVGSAGAFITFNGAGGTPSSLTLTNATGLPLAGMANVATATVFYRKTAGTGAPEVQTLATLKTDLGLTGTNSGDQTITLTGDATGSGIGSFAVAVVKINGVALSGLATGILKNTTTTGVPSIAVAADFPTLNQNTTGSAATLTTSRNIAGNPFNGSANISINDTDLSGAAWTVYSPGAPVPAAGAFTTVATTGRYKQIGKTVFFSIEILITTNGTAASYFTVALPVASVSSGHNQAAHGVDEGTTGFGALGWVVNNSTTLLVTKYDGNYLGVNGSKIIMQGCYEAA